MEQREIKVRLFHCLSVFLLFDFFCLPLSFSCFSFCALRLLLVSPHPLYLLVPCLSSCSCLLFDFPPLHVIISAAFNHAVSSFPMFSFNSFLSALPAGRHVPVSPLFISIRLFLLLSPQFISLVSIQRGGPPSCCPPVHICFPRRSQLDCDWLVCSFQLLCQSPGVFLFTPRCIHTAATPLRGRLQEELVDFFQVQLQPDWNWAAAASRVARGVNTQPGWHESCDQGGTNTLVFFNS